MSEEVVKQRTEELEETLGAWKPELMYAQTVLLWHKPAHLFAWLALLHIAFLTMASVEVSNLTLGASLALVPLSVWMAQQKFQLPYQSWMAQATVLPDGDATRTQPRSFTTLVHWAAVASAWLQERHDEAAALKAQSGLQWGARVASVLVALSFLGSQVSDLMLVYLLVITAVLLPGTLAHQPYLTAWAVVKPYALRAARAVDHEAKQRFPELWAKLIARLDKLTPPRRDFGTKDIAKIPMSPVSAGSRHSAASTGNIAAGDMAPVS